MESDSRSNSASEYIVKVCNKTQYWQSYKHWKFSLLCHRNNSSSVIFAASEKIPKFYVGIKIEPSSPTQDFFHAIAIDSQQSAPSIGNWRHLSGFLNTTINANPNVYAFRQMETPISRVVRPLWLSWHEIHLLVCNPPNLMNYIQYIIDKPNLQEQLQNG